MNSSKNILVFYTSKNSRGKHDATGAFIPEAKGFAEFHKIPPSNMFAIPCIRQTRFNRRQRVLDAIRKQPARSVDALAFFGHGWPKGIQHGFDRENIPELVREMSRACKPDAKVVLYACLAAENDERDRGRYNVGPSTDGGFADTLRDEMVRGGLGLGWVDGHKTAGHTTWNPYVVRFRCDSVLHEFYGGVGGAWLVQPGSEYWGQWIKACRKDMRFRFIFMSELAIKCELGGYDYFALPGVS